jgi:hypothetical protein
LLRSQYNIQEKDMVVLAPPVYQQLLERMPQHLRNTTFAHDQVAPAPRARRRAAELKQEAAREPAQARDSLLELELLRVLQGGAGPAYAAAVKVGISHSPLRHRYSAVTKADAACCVCTHRGLATSNSRRKAW